MTDHNKILIFFPFVLFLFSSPVAQNKNSQKNIPIDTSFTVYSAYEKVIKEPYECCSSDK